MIKLVSDCCKADVREIKTMQESWYVCQKCYKTCKAVKQSKPRLTSIAGELDVISEVTGTHTRLSNCCGARAYKTKAGIACAHCGLRCGVHSGVLNTIPIRFSKLEVIRLQELIRVHFGDNLPVLSDKLALALKEFITYESTGDEN